MVNSTERRPGRRPGDPGTQDDILAAAREAFAASGYRDVTIRAIAAAAGVDPALVLHYFGNKEGLFRAAMQPPFEPAWVLRRALEGDPGQAGTAVARFFLETWEPTGQRRTLLALVRAAVSEESAAAMIREDLLRAVETMLASTGVDHPRLRAALIGSQLVGLAMARHVIRAPGAVEAQVDDLARAAGPTLQRYISGPLFEAEVANG